MLEKLLVSFQDSSRFRHFAKRGAGATLFRSDAYKKAYLARLYVSSYLTARLNSAAVTHVNTLCLFIGHNKSGTSMLGALLDAHPNVILSDEVDALKYIDAGFDRSQLFHVLIRASRRELIKGRVTARRLGGYSWHVPGQWQGRYRSLSVVGDSTSGTSTRKLFNDPTLLPKLQKRLGRSVEAKFILVIRNPFDPITFIMIRGGRSFENAIAHYFDNCDMVMALRDRIGGDRLLPMRYESFIERPRAELTAVCHFLGLNAPDDYLDACTSILHSQPEKGRHLIPWDKKQIQAVEARIKDYDFLQGYSFHS